MTLRLLRRFSGVLAAGTVFLLWSVLFAAMVGPYGPLRTASNVPEPMTAGDVLATLAGGGDAGHRAVVLEIRMPRILLALLVGLVLALAGTAMQSVLRNPLAEPYILGVSSGASLGASASIVFGLSAAAAAAGGELGAGGSYLPLGLLAFGGGLGATFTTYGIARAAGTPQGETLLLAGVALNSLLTALLLAILFFADEQFRSLFFWILGGFGHATWPGVALLAFAGVPSFVFLVHRSTAMNLLLLGDDQAASLGVEVRREKRNLLVVASLLASLTVAVAGAIGFVGLIIPHLVRLLLGADNRLVVPAAALFGASFLIWTDLLSRVLLPTGELPIGILTAFCGAPFFLLLLTRRRRDGVVRY